MLETIILLVIVASVSIVALLFAAKGSKESKCLECDKVNSLCQTCIEEGKLK